MKQKLSFAREQNSDCDLSVGKKLSIRFLCCMKNTPCLFFLHISLLISHFLHERNTPQTKKLSGALMSNDPLLSKNFIFFFELFVEFI